MEQFGSQRMRRKEWERKDRRMRCEGERELEKGRKEREKRKIRENI